MGGRERTKERKGHKISLSLVVSFFVLYILQLNLFCETRDDEHFGRKKEKKQEQGEGEKKGKSAP